jgi:hypothetical protein
MVHKKDSVHPTDEHLLGGPALSAALLVLLLLMTGAMG